jgi:hypothetical protein
VKLAEANSASERSARLSFALTNIGVQISASEVRAIKIYSGQVRPREIAASKIEPFSHLTTTFDPKSVVIQDFPKSAISRHPTNLPYAQADVYNGGLGSNL